MDDPVQHAAPEPPSWVEIFRGDLAVYTVLLNLGVLFFGMDSFMINTLMPTVVADIGGVAYYAWAAMLFLVGATMGSAGYGPFRAQLGGRNALLAGAAVYGLSQLCCAIAPNMGALLAARFFAGLGGGAILAGSLGFTGTLYEPRIRTHAVAFISIAWIGCAIIGPIVGGIFANIGWWRGAFWLDVPFAVLFLVAVWWKISPDLDRPNTRSRVAVPVVRLLCLGIGVLCVGAAGRAGSNAERIALITAAIAVCWYAFWRDARKDDRLFPSHPLSLSRRIGLGYWTIILMVSVYSAIMVFLPLVLTVLQGVTPLYVGFANAVMSTAWSIAAIVVAALSPGAQQRAAIVGALVMLAACIGLAAEVHFAIGLPAIVALAVAAGFGIGLVAVNLQAGCMTAALSGEESITASSLATIRSLGQAFGAAIAGTVANFAGLELVATRASVTAAAFDVYLFCAIPLALSVLTLARYFRTDASQQTNGTVRA